MKNLEKVLRLILVGICIILMITMIYFSLGAWDTSIGGIAPQTVHSGLDKLFWVFTCCGAAGILGIIGYGIVLKQLLPSKIAKSIAGLSVVLMMSGLYYHYIFGSPL